MTGCKVKTLEATKLQLITHSLGLPRATEEAAATSLLQGYCHHHHLATLQLSIGLWGRHCRNFPTRTNFNSDSAATVAAAYNTTTTRATTGQ